ncbi:nuclear transport factor 2 family protein [Piscinibacter sp. XHJ-5]|uniref:YybH family protein n=1 Tax=Piscinibacter sp. XHJ-5 TaxID=3037797 RepID=UPI0024535F39|nr:nuclear transport factor 2 family protein [Piscinibacter sp. XHJ-5]
MTRIKPPQALLGSPDEIEAQFYEALQRGDIDRLMAVWSDDDDIVCVHPGGPRLVGAAAIRGSFETLFANGSVDAQPEKVRRVLSHSSAVHNVLERVQVMGSDGPQAAWVIATNVYLKGAQGWRLVCHHASPGTPRELQEVIETATTLH